MDQRITPAPGTGRRLGRRTEPGSAGRVLELPVRRNLFGILFNSIYLPEWESNQFGRRGESTALGAAIHGLRSTRPSMGSRQGSGLFALALHQERMSFLKLGVSETPSFEGV